MKSCKTPETIMKELFRTSSKGITFDSLMKDFKEIFMPAFVKHFPELLLYENLNMTLEGTPEADKLEGNSLIFQLSHLLPLHGDFRYNQEYNKAIMKLLYGYLLIRDRSAAVNLFFDITAEYYHALVELLEFVCTSEEEKLLFLYSLAMNDLGKTNTIIDIVKQRRLIPSEIYIDHDEKWYLFLKYCGQDSSILPGWNSVLFSSYSRTLFIEGQSTSINYPQLLQGENIKLCLKKFCSMVSRPAQLFRLFTQVIDMTGAKSALTTWRSFILKNELFEHSIIGISLILSEKEEAYDKFFEIIYRKEIEEFFSANPSFPRGFSPESNEQVRKLKFFYGRIAALSRLNDHQVGNIEAIHAAWVKLSEVCPRSYDLLCKELTITGCDPHEVVGILIYFAPALVITAMAAIGSDKAKGIFYGLQALALSYENGREKLQHSLPSSSPSRAAGSSDSISSEDWYLTVNARDFMDKIKKNFAELVGAGDLLTVWPEPGETREETTEPAGVVKADGDPSLKRPVNTVFIKYFQDYHRFGGLSASSHETSKRLRLDDTPIAHRAS
jgi:hypothetical protein